MISEGDTEDWIIISYDSQKQIGFKVGYGKNRKPLFNFFFFNFKFHNISSFCISDQINAD